jgi:hypothetical protein
LAPPEFTIAELRGLFSAALGYEVSATNLTRVLTRRHVIGPTERTAPPGQSGGRPATVYKFVARELTVTDPFAVLRPHDDVSSSRKGPVAAVTLTRYV